MPELVQPPSTCENCGKPLPTEIIKGEVNFMEYCNLYCYRDHLQKLSDKGGVR